MRLDDMALHTDKYQINMMYGHWRKGRHNKTRAFDVFFRKLPFDGGYVMFAGLERIVQYISGLSFTADDIAYLAAQEENYDRGFLDELKNFRFTGSIWSAEEGTLVFPNEPIIRVEARNFENKLVETAILNFLYQALVATKASRVRRVTPGDYLMEFGMRRAHEGDASLYAARSAYIAGFDATSNMRAGKIFGIPTKGTHSHAWVQDYPTEIEAFTDFVEVFPNNSILLVDTYDTLKSGVPNAIKAAKHLEGLGSRLSGIRLDSGDLTYLSIKARELLDEAGLDYVKIVASNDLDEHKIASLKSQGAAINSWGVGTQLVTCADSPALGMVYKMAAKQETGDYEPSIKVSANPEKVTTPGRKTVYRIVNQSSGKSEGDYIAEVTEDVRGQKRLKMFDPVHTWLYKYATGFEAVELLKPVFINGEQVYGLPSLEQIRKHHQEQLSLFWPEYLRLFNPEAYPVDMSERVWNTKMELVKQYAPKMNPFPELH